MVSNSLKRYLQSFKSCINTLYISKKKKVKEKKKKVSTINITTFFTVI